METRSVAVAGKAYATAVKVSTTNTSVKTDLTDLIIKEKSDIEKARKQASQVSLDSLNSQEACTSGQPRQSKPVSKETKSHQKSVSLNRKKPEADVCSGRLKNAVQHLIPISNSYFPHCNSFCILPYTLADLGDEDMDIC